MACCRSVNVTGLSTVRIGLIQVQPLRLDCLTLKMKALRPVETSASVY